MTDSMECVEPVSGYRLTFAPVPVRAVADEALGALDLRVLAAVAAHARTVVEDGEHGPRIRLLSPTEQPHSDNSALRVSGPSEDTTPVSGPSVGEGAT